MFDTVLNEIVLYESVLQALRDFLDSSQIDIKKAFEK